MFALLALFATPEVGPWFAYTRFGGTRAIDGSIAEVVVVDRKLRTRPIYRRPVRQVWVESMFYTGPDVRFLLGRIVVNRERKLLGMIDHIEREPLIPGERANRGRVSMVAMTYSGVIKERFSFGNYDNKNDLWIGFDDDGHLAAIERVSDDRFTIWGTSSRSVESELKLPMLRRSVEWPTPQVWLEPAIRAIFKGHWTQYVTLPEWRWTSDGAPWVEMGRDPASSATVASWGAPYGMTFQPEKISFSAQWGPKRYRVLDLPHWFILRSLVPLTEPWIIGESDQSVQRYMGSNDPDEDPAAYTSIVIMNMKTGAQVAVGRGLGPVPL